MMDKPKYCKECNKTLNNNNTKGLCSKCYKKVYSHNYYLNFTKIGRQLARQYKNGEG